MNPSPIVLAHVGGLPLEELATAAGPVLGTGFAVFALAARARLGEARRRRRLRAAERARRASKGAR